MATIIQIKRSSGTSAPSTLKLGELAYTYGTGTQGNLGDRLFVGEGGVDGEGNANNISVIGGQYFTDQLDHAQGTLTASSAVLVDANKAIDEFIIGNSSSTGGTLKLNEGTSNGAHFAAIKAPNSLAASYTLTLPSNDGDANQFLQTDGNGALSWADVSSTITLAADSGTNDTFTTGNTLTFSGGTGIDTTVSNDEITIAIDSTVATASSTTTLTNKTFDANGTGNSISNIEVADLASGVLDTDLSSVSASDDTLASAKAIKTYIDTQVTAQDLDFQADTGGALAIDLDSETLTFTGGTGIDTSGSGNTVTFAIDSTVTTNSGTQTLTNKSISLTTNTLSGTTAEFNTALSDGSFATLAGTETLTNKTLTTPIISSISNTGTLTLPTSTDTLVGRATTDTLTNKTLTSPVINTGVSGTAVLDDDTFATATASTLATSESIKAYVDTTVAATNEVVEDTTPQLGGDLDLNSNDITGTGNINITGTIQSSGNITGTLATAAQPNITSLGTLTGLTTTGDINFGDNDKAVFGADSDLQIYHDGSNSYVQDAGDGALILNTTNGGGVYVYSAGETMATFNSNGAVNFYYDNAPKLATTSTGIDVTGTATMGGLTVENTEGATLNINTALAGADSKILLHEGSTASPANGASIRYDGANNLFKIGVGSSVDTTRLTIARDTGIVSLSAGIDVDGTIKLDGNYPTGTANVALGDTALDSVTASGNGENIAIGNAALTANTSGERNIAIGNNALDANIDTDRNIAIGSFALSNSGATGSGETNNIGIGYNSLGANTTGTDNVGVGSLTIDANTTGSNNTGIGKGALSANTT